MVPTVPDGGVGLSARWALVAGATGRIGGVLSRALARRGTHLVLQGRSSPDELAAELARDHGVQTVPVSADVTSDTALRRMTDVLASAAVDRLDAVVNCVTAFDGRPRPVGELDTAEFRRVVDVDLVGSYQLVQATRPLLEKAEQPRLVFVSSLAGVRGRLGAAHLCAAKAGVIGLTLAFSREFAPQRILVNAIAPGPVRPPDGVPHPKTSVPLSFSDPEDVVDTALFLASPLNRRLTGQVLVVNGGEP